MARRFDRVGRRHMVIPDTQVKPGVNTDHLEAAGNYAVAKKPDVIVVIGDWWDMPSLSSYEQKGSKYFHDKSYRGDVDAGNAAMGRFMSPIVKEVGRLKRNKDKHWQPRLVFTLGNHEERILRAAHNDPVLEGTIGLHDLDIESWGFELHQYRAVVDIDGVLYSHFFENPNARNGKPASGFIQTRLKNVGASFTQGHQQTRDIGTIYNARGHQLTGLVVGAFYSHDEGYQGPQGNNYWRGIVIKNEVKDGAYDPMFVSLEYLVRRWL